MNLYFGNFVTTVSTLMICTAIAFITYLIIHHRQIKLWGRHIAMLALFGLVLCCFVVTRDSYHLSVQSSFDNTVMAGLFTLDSIQSILCCTAAVIIAYSSISSIFIKSQKYRKIMFFMLSTSIIFKILIIEISRWMV